MSSVVVALDCGTHAARALAFDVSSGAATTCATEGIPLQFPKPGWVEVDPEVLAAAAVSVLRTALEWANECGHQVVALGLANMRETAFAWRRSTSASVYPGIMWMSQQSVPTVKRWRDQGLDSLIRDRTGLTNDAFFFGSKVAWLLEHEPQVEALARNGDLAVGTADSWLLHQLTGGRVHRTDVANGSRTQLMNLRTRTWDPDLCSALGVSASCLPKLTPTMAQYGVTDARVCGQEIPITGVVADQQGSLLGHGCEQVGAGKTTFGTSGVVSVNLGPDVVLRPGLVTSVAWTDVAGDVAYEIEGSAFHAGYTLGWLAERFRQPVDLAEPMTPGPLGAQDRVYVLPAFSVMGAPRWPSRHGAAITGLAMDTTTADIRRAGAEAMAFQAYDLFAAMGDAASATLEMNVDGGGAANDFLCQLLADLLEMEVVRPHSRELTSVGAAKAALRGLGHEVDPHFGQDRTAAERFVPTGHDDYARAGYQRWVELVEAILR